MARTEGEVQGIGRETQEGASMIYFALVASITILVLTIIGALPS